MLPDNVTVEIFEGVGHFLHLEQPDDVNRRIVEFLDGAITASDRPRRPRCPTASSSS